jgi:CPA2 family monovalent cation:H+ antiporter-2
VAHRLRLPPLIGYLLAGVAVGPFTPGYVADASIANELAEIGVILLMFGVGMHFSVRDLIAVRGVALPGALGQMAIATALGWIAAWRWGWSARAACVFGLALSCASTVVLLRALELRGKVATPEGRLAMGWLIVQDLAMVVALVVLPAVLGPATSGTGLRSATWLAIVTTLGKMAAFVALMLVVGARFVPWLLARVERTGSRELFTLAVVALALGVAFGAAELFGVSFALGAFVAGLVLNGTPHAQRAAEDALPLRDAFAVLFFVSVGMLFDPSILVREPLRVLVVLAIVILGNALAAFVILRLQRTPVPGALTVAASLAQIGEFSFMLAGLGVSLGLLAAEGRHLVLAGALLSITLNPLVLAAVDALQGRTENPLARARARK